MSHEELFALKLQMGINPSSEIGPDVLLAMWQQLTFERENAQRTQAGRAPATIPVTNNRLVV